MNTDTDEVRFLGNRGMYFVIAVDISHLIILSS